MCRLYKMCSTLCICALDCQVIHTPVSCRQVVWHTSITKTGTNQLENVQKRAVRLFRGPCYNEAIAIASLPKLAERRETLGRNCPRTCNNCTISCLAQDTSLGPTQYEMHTCTVSTGVGQVVYNTDCIIGINWAFFIIYEHCVQY